jgi:hypothetical protein
MPPLDDIAPNFRIAADRWKDAPTLAKHYDSLSARYNGNDHGIIETAKSFLECFCITVLGEYGKPMPSATPTTTELLVESLKTLGLQNSPGAGELGAILKAHNKLADSLSVMRNTRGPIAHGKDGFQDCLTNNQCRTYVLICDTLLAILIAAHTGKDPDLQFTREPYERFAHLHARIDKSASIEAEIEDDDDEQTLIVRVGVGTRDELKEFRIEPSRLLYLLDRTAYIDVLNGSELITTEAEPPSTPTVAVEEAQVGATESMPTVTRTEAYTGNFTAFRNSLSAYVTALGVPSPPASADSADFVNSIMATLEINAGTDWTERPTIQARMKVALRRLFVGFGLPVQDVENYAEHIVEWLRRQLAGVGSDGGENG